MCTQALEQEKGKEGKEWMEEGHPWPMLLVLFRNSLYISAIAFLILISFFQDERVVSEQCSGASGVSISDSYQLNLLYN